MDPPAVAGVTESGLTVERAAAPMRRHHARPARSFDAAAADRLSSDWLTGTTNINDLLRAQLPILRARSRHLARNTDYAARFIGMFRENVVGHQGVQLQSKATNVSGKPDELAAAAIEAKWTDWCLHHCDLLNQLTFLDFQNLSADTFARDGEFLMRKVVGVDAEPYGLRLQPVDAERLSCNYNVDLGGNRFIRMGVEYDPIGRPVAYHVTNNPTGDSYLGMDGQPRLRIPADQMIHGYIISEIGQGRGIPPMTCTMVRMNQIAKYEQAALVNARIGASTMGILTQVDGDNELTSDTADGDGPEFEVEPGIFKKLPAGWDVKTFDPAYPSGEFGVFLKAGLRGMSAGLNVAYHGLTGDLESVNYSSGRIGELKERASWMAVQGWYTRAFVGQVFNSWLREALMRQLIIVRGRPLSLANESKFQAVNFRCKRWPWVDPMKDAQAAEKLVGLRVRSRSDIIRDMGGDPEDTWREIARENETMANIGVAPATEAATAKKGKADAEQQESAGAAGPNGHA